MELLIQFTGNHLPVRVTVHALEQLILKMRLVRLYQKQYLSTKQETSLQLAKQFEKEIDQQLSDIIEGKQETIGF